MLRQLAVALEADTVTTLNSMQKAVNKRVAFGDKIALANELWKAKAWTKARKSAFADVRLKLSAMCYGSVRCSYCEDSAADEIEHIVPKTIIPSKTFVWENYCFACGPCNGPKSNAYAEVGPVGQLVQFHGDDITNEPSGLSAFLHPRLEDPGSFLDLDIGGTDPSGFVVGGTFMFAPREDCTVVQRARANFTIDTLRLNRELVRKARETAYQSYRACLHEYAEAKSQGVGVGDLAKMKEGILAMPHPTVLNEMIRLKSTQPRVRLAIAAAPEIQQWIR